MYASNAFFVKDSATGYAPGELTFAHVRTFVDEVVTVTEDAIADAVRWLFAEAHLVVEPSGAVTVAAALQGGGSSAIARPLAIISGGNVDPEDFAKYLTGMGRAPSTATPAEQQTRG